MSEEKAGDMAEEMEDQSSETVEEQDGTASERAEVEARQDEATEPETGDSQAEQPSDAQEPADPSDELVTDEDAGNEEAGAVDDAPQITPEAEENADEDSEPLAEESASDETEAVEAEENETEPQMAEAAETSETDDEDEQADEQPERASEPEDGREWYVLHCYSGYENKVRHNLEQRIESMDMKDMIFDVVVPTEEEIEVKEGKRRTVERRVFPGYILVNMLLTEDSWYVVRNTPGVTSFVGQGNTPLPLRPEEVSQIIKRMEADAPRIKVTFRQGERVRIVDGPFNDFHGTVSEIDMERTKVRVMVNFFGRETPVELDFLQVEKA